MPSTDTWSTVYPAPDPEHGFPGACSVHGLVSGAHPHCAAASRREGRLVRWTCRRRRLLGRRMAAPRHVYTHVPSTPSLDWKKLRVEGTKSHRQIEYADAFRALGTDLPEPRGWFPPAECCHIPYDAVHSHF
ncbi:hypothetical protein L210DRAFT_3765311 [Boletus edulis BED1]|uniref:Uncharacterized protein n=1 Tax=Boletus edulis BED1 TaxID=1328754 RepID=A0AAD4G7B0_BOLED|nr:hypothetical protein L210DRAFT_3765311 [Boletus edulis BED1]